MGVRRESRHRSRRRITATALVALIAVACSGGEDESAAPAARPDIVLITLDTLRPDHTDVFHYRGRTTPFLSDLASRSAVFEQAFSTSSWTAPSTASIFTGLYPNEHGVIAGFRAHAKRGDHKPEEGVPLPNSAVTVHERMQLVRLPGARATLAEHLSRAGYATFGVAANINIGSDLGFDRGFDEFERLYRSPAEEVVTHVLDRREELARRRPYFLYLHLNDAHQPYKGRAEFGYVGGLAGIEDEVARYDSEIRYLDHWLGELYRELGWGTDTVLMIVSDHGEEFLDHGRTGHRFSLYSELNDVLMMVSAPGVVPARRVAQTVSLIDALPTLLAAAGVAAPADLEGRSLLPLARGETDAWEGERTVFAHRIRGNSEEPLFERPPLWAVISGSWKLIHDSDQGTLELYDTVVDPRETEELAARHPEVVARLRAELADFLSSSVRHAGAEVSIDVDDGLLKRLEELGYAGSD